MKRWMRALALVLALLLGTAALAEDMTLPEKIAAAEEEVLQWLEDGGAITEDEARRAAEYLLTRGEALFAGEGALSGEEAVHAAQAVTYLKQACARGHRRGQPRGAPVHRHAHGSGAALQAGAAVGRFRRVQLRRGF